MERLIHFDLDQKFTDEMFVSAITCRRRGFISPVFTSSGAL